MWLPNTIIESVDEYARIYYIDAKMCQNWNTHRKEGELRMLTGWCWVSKTDTRNSRQGFKTMTVAYRDAYYALVRKELAPRPTALRLIRRAS
jgi:hypothetical protein